MSNSPSATLEFKGLGESDMERLVASIWCILEEHGLGTPLLDVRCQSPITMTLTFQSAEDRALVIKNMKLGVALISSSL